MMLAGTARTIGRSRRRSRSLSSGSRSVCRSGSLGRRRPPPRSLARAPRAPRTTGGARDPAYPRRQDGKESRPRGGQAPDQANSGRQTGAAAHTRTDHSQGCEEEVEDGARFGHSKRLPVRSTARRGATAQPYASVPERRLSVLSRLTDSLYVVVRANASDEVRYVARRLHAVGIVRRLRSASAERAYRASRPLCAARRGHRVRDRRSEPPDRQRHLWDSPAPVHMCRSHLRRRERLLAPLECRRDPNRDSRAE